MPRYDVAWLEATIERVHAAGGELIPTRTSVRVVLPRGACAAMALGRELQRDVRRNRLSFRRYLEVARCSSCRDPEVLRRGDRCEQCTPTWRSALRDTRRRGEG